MEKIECEQRFQLAHDLYIAEDYSRAFEEYLALAKEGFSNSQAFVAWMYRKGIGVEENRGNAYAWYKKASESGDAEAQYYLANMCIEDGDIDDAVRWFKFSASLNYPPSQYRLGWHYDNGRGVLLDKCKAFEFYKKSAFNGNIFAKKAYALKLMMGREGINGMLKGTFIFFSVFFLTIKIMMDDEDSERLQH